MNKQYKKPFYLDTCIAKNILGFDDNDEIERLYNKDKLLKYIKHHGCVFTVFTMFEILRDEKLDKDNSILDNLHSLNYEIFVPGDMVDADFTSNYKEKIYDKAERESFVKMINDNVINYASRYYSKILLYPFALNLYAIVVTSKNHNIKIDYKKMNSLAVKMIDSVSNQLNKTLKIAGQFRKNSSLRIINSAYKWITHLTIEWFNGEMNELSKDIEHGDIYKTCEEYMERLKHVDFNREIEDNLSLEIKDKKDSKIQHSVYANGEFNFLLLLEELGFSLTDGSIKKNEWIAKFIQFNKNILSKFYKINGDVDIVDKYFFINIYEFYFMHMCGHKGEFDPEKSIKKLIDTNDIVDLLSLYFVEAQRTIFLTTDNKIKRVIKRTYDKARWSTFCAFINISN